MKAINANITKTIVRGSKIDVCDNSGAKKAYLVSVKGSKTRKGRFPTAGVGDLLKVSIVQGNQEMRKQLVPAVLVRQRKEYMRPDGTRIKFEDNAVIICKDEKGNPKGTIFKGPIAKEATERWPAIGKVAKIIV
ncbi:50S ribosomal protein L14 [Candidatus Woesearchaeota archaeon]|jgi:large subunit ribosomal protein L14|nr:50S ribosomal protein L14 [Candidatus Woesearchaeota archaeon]MBT4835208.1 50S ribosomal protein L14 [Candidatus Woesearchaeota archaeon]MBT7169568.1 50S ribosomal protein L14 [Candidatus Woesearchaeota archaeon]MBT7474526.1 50S ribosomal protein L14 [Candidatus Woesearchaeota archaeon]